VGHSIFVAFSGDLDKDFMEVFRSRPSEDSRLLILNEGVSTDRLLTRIIALPIRTSERCYIVETKCGMGKSYFATAVFHSLLQRLAAGLEADDAHERILDAKMEDGILHVVSPQFRRLDVPLADIPDLKQAKSCQREDFEIDEDGAFIYWPELDVHLGWSQLQQLVNPEAAFKASQKTAEFNKRYGGAVQKLREESELKRSEITDLSEKQLGRIEKGECRLTSNAIDALAKAHKMEPNEYMKKLAEALE